MAALTSSRLRLHQLRAYALAAPTDAPQTALMAQPLTKQIAQLLRAYAIALLLSCAAHRSVPATFKHWRSV